MSPEQRLTVRQAVDLIAERGTAPITEAALRARIRARRVGVVRVGSRVYTNPLNLVTAGLLPVEALDGVKPVPRAEIDDAELHAWLNPPERTAAPPETQRAPAHSQNPRSEPAVDPPPRVGDADERDIAGPLEQAFAADATPLADVARDEPLAVDAIGTGDRTAKARGRARVHPARRRGAWVLVIVLVTLIVATGLAIGNGDGDPGTVAQVQGASLVSVQRDFDGALVDAGERAGGRGDYDAALELAAAAGSPQAMERWQRVAATVLLSRARRAADLGRVQDARRQLRRLRARYGDPLPDRRRAVLVSVRRSERTVRERTAVRRAQEASRAAAVVSASSAATGSGNAGAASSSTSAGSGGSATGGGSASRSSGSSSANGPGEFF